MLERDKIVCQAAFLCVAAAIILVIVLIGVALIALVAGSVYMIAYGGIPGVAVGIVGIVVAVMLIQYYIHKTFPVE